MIKNIIAFSGAHGTGKTTAVYELATKLKKEGKDVGIILETARQCPFPVMSVESSAPSIEAQLWIFSRQIQAEIEASERYEVVISDRTIIDCIAYTLVHHYYGLASAFKHTASHIIRYQEIIFRPIATNDYCTDDGFRHMDPEKRVQIENTMLMVYEWLQIPITVLQ